MMSTHLRIIEDPTNTRAPPVAHPGIDEKIGAKNTETKKANPVTIPVIPVFPPSAKRLDCSIDANDVKSIPLIPVALSTNVVTGLVPIKAPILIANASTQYAIVEFSKSIVSGSCNPANRAMEYRVL
jgi:hypothetical protein